MKEIVTMKSSNGHLIKIIKRPKDANGYKYVGIYYKNIKEDNKHGNTNRT